MKPMWKAVDDAQLPLRFHTFPTTAPRARGMTSGQVRRAAMFTGVSAFQYDVIGPKLINTNNPMTTETLMWGSDYPHTDGIWPESTKYIEEQFVGLTPEQIQQITCDNAAKFYNLTN